MRRARPLAQRGLLYLPELRIAERVRVILTKGKMTEKPILFSTPMVRAILNGRKTETRRVIKNPEQHQIEWDGYNAFFEDHYGDRHHINTAAPYQPGQPLWVRETFCPVDDTEFNGKKWIDYRATPWDSAKHPAGWENAPNDEQALKWKPSIFMPRKYARLFLEVNSIHAERLQDITEEGARAEGMGKDFVLLESEFEILWNNLNKKRGFGWDTNPWVWVIKFSRIKQDENLPSL